MNKSGYVAIVGWPNAGKSTLMNKLLGFKLSIVSSKPQTTRESIMGIINEKDHQLVFLDTPGWLSPSDVLQTSMKKNILRSMFDDADVILWVVDAHSFTEKEEIFAETLKKPLKPVVIAVNKVDNAQHERKWELAKTRLAEILPDTPILSVSAKAELGFEPLKKVLMGLLPEGPAYFPLDQVTNRFERFYVCELIREQVMQKFQEEVPHATAVLLDEFIEKAGKKDVIQVSIIVETEGQKKIVIGKAGSKIRELGMASRKEIETFLGRPVFLELHVKVKKHWRKDAQFLKELQGTDN